MRINRKVLELHGWNISVTHEWINIEGTTPLLDPETYHNICQQVYGDTGLPMSAIEKEFDTMLENLADQRLLKTIQEARDHPTS